MKFFKNKSVKLGVWPSSEVFVLLIYFVLNCYFFTLGRNLGVWMQGPFEDLKKLKKKKKRNIEGSLESLCLIKMGLVLLSVTRNTMPATPASKFPSGN